MRRIGFFKELGHGDPDGLSIADAKGPLPGRTRVADYLEGATVLIASPGLAVSVVADCDARLARHIQTDGLWAWPMDLAHYVRHHGVTVPDDMLARIEAAEYVPPMLSLAELRALEA